jgi:broad specificity phosphatase PhoE
VKDDSKDPALTDVGHRRAENLAVVLKSAAVKRVFSSDYKRTRDTAAPLATRLGLEIELYNPKELESLAARLLELEENALVVGHSNTTPDLADFMGGDGFTPIADDWEYDRLYLLQTSKDTVKRTILLHLPPETSASE